MHTKMIFRTCLLALLAMAGWPSASAAGTVQGADQQHAFDFHFGTWQTHIQSRDVTASGVGAWTEFTGTVIGGADASRCSYSSYFASPTASPCRHR